MTKEYKNGIYNLSFEEYDAIDALNSSALKELRRSPAHCKAYLDETKKTTDSMIFGKAVHAAILEPDEFKNKFTYRTGKLNTKVGKDEFSALTEKYTPENILKKEDYDSIIGIKESFEKCPPAVALFRDAGQKEASIIFEHMGAKCKARLDAINFGVATIIDIKTCTNASYHSFKRDVENYNYWLQAAFYRRAAQAATMAVKFVTFVAVEKEPPYAIACYQMSEAAMDRADYIIDELVAKWIRAKEINRWDAYSDTISIIDMPQWFYESTSI